MTGLLVFVLTQSKFTSLTIKWSPLLGILIALFCFLAIQLIFSGLSLCFNSKILYLIFGFLTLVCLVMLMGLTVFSLVNSSTKAISNLFGCEKNSFNKYDSYLHKVDETLCSKDCKCDLEKPEDFTTSKVVYKSKGKEDAEEFYGDDSVKRNLDFWVFSSGKNSTANLSVSFPNCSQTVQDEVNSKFDENLNANKTNSKRFLEEDEKDNKKEDSNSYKMSSELRLQIDIYSLLETHFECTGMCETSYVDSSNNKRRIHKYLFTDINRGVPKYDGCVKSVSEWAPEKLLITGLTSLGLSIFYMIIVWSTFHLICTKENDDQE